MRTRLLSIVLCIIPSVLWGESADTMDPASMPHYGQWRSSMIGGGGYIQNVVFTSSPKRLYAYVDVGGFFRSDDGGHAWRMMHGGLPNMTGRNEVRALDADPRNPDRILVACGNANDPRPLGIFLSEDGGQTLKQVLTARFAGNAEFRWTGLVLVRDPADPDRLLAGSFGDGMYRSTDAGRTWTPAGDNTRGLNFTDVQFDRTDPSRAWACAQKLDTEISGRPAPLAGGFLTSTDGGAAWKKLSDDAPSEIEQDPRLPRIYGIFAGGASIRASDDAGLTWKELTAGLMAKPETRSYFDINHCRYQAIAAGPDFMLLSSSMGDFYRLPSGQSQWQPVHREGVNYRGWYGGRRADGLELFGQMVANLAIDPRNPDHWFYADAFAIFDTTDAGKHWTVRVDGIEVTVIHTLCQDPADPGRVHLGMADNGYFQSEDGATSFASKLICTNVKDIELSPRLPARVYAVGTGAWEWASNQVFVSIDGGTNWSRSPMIGLPDMDKARCNTIAVNPDDPYECFLAVSGAVRPGGGGPYRSTDGGKSWQWIGQGIPENWPLFSESIWIAGRQIAAGPGGHVACVGPGSLYRLDRASMQWQRSALEGNLYAIVADPNTPGTWIVAGDAGIYRAQSASLTRVYDRKVMHLAADSVRAGRFAAADHDGILLSTDSGKSWKLLDESLPQKLGYSAIAFAGDRLVASAGGCGNFWIPLTPAASAPVRAAPVAAVPASATSPATPVLRNLDFGEGKDFPSYWDGRWLGRGKVSAARDDQVLLGGKPTLRLQTDVPDSAGSISQQFDATHDEFMISGTARLEGEVSAAVAVQVWDASWKQIAWLRPVEFRTPGEGQKFSARVTIPGAGARAALVLLVEGNGKAWFGDLHISLSPAIFR